VENVGQLRNRKTTIKRKKKKCGISKSNRKPSGNSLKKAQKHAKKKKLKQKLKMIKQLLMLACRLRHMLRSTLRRSPSQNSLTRSTTFSRFSLSAKRFSFRVSLTRVRKQWVQLIESLQL
jgi:hypothetical protein